MRRGPRTAGSWWVGCGTYNLGFFLGPGLPRGLGSEPVSINCPRLLLDPAETPFFFLGPSAAARSEGVGAGVELDSEALSLTSGSFKGDASSSGGAGDEASDGDDCSSDLAERFSNRRRSLGDNLNVTIFSCFLFLSARAIEADGDRPAVLEDDGAMGYDGECCIGG